LKTEENPNGLFTEHEMYMVLTTVFSALFFDVDATKSYSLDRAATAVAQQLGQVVEATVKADTNSGLLSGLMNSFRPHDNALREYGTSALRRLEEAGLNSKEITWSQIIPTIVGLVPHQGQAFTQVIEYYTGEEGKKHLSEINRLAKEESKENDEKLFRYCLEAIRINGTFGAYRQAVRDITVEDDGKTIGIKAGQEVFASYVQANHDPSIFPEPNEVNLDRPLDSYLSQGAGANTGFGQEITKIALVSMLRVVGRLENLRRAPGAQGQLKKIPQEGGYYVYLRQDGTSYFPFPMCKFNLFSDYNHIVLIETFYYSAQAPLGRRLHLQAISVSPSRLKYTPFTTDLMRSGRGLMCGIPCGWPWLTFWFCFRERLCSPGYPEIVLLVIEGFIALVYSSNLKLIHDKAIFLFLHRLCGFFVYTGT
jgi:hypothetical protein